ncbi:MAG TPA: hypothetical protein VL549_13225 [Gemmatimonadales bacterium]|nr:hypothetical protein [Gemmatimonadales bacterium]
MKRLCGVLLVVLSARGAFAQTGTRLPVQFVASGDSVFAVPSGGSLALVVASQYDGSGSGLDSFAVRVHYDPTRFTYVSATKLCTNLGPALNVSTGSAFVDVSTASCTSPYFGEPLFRITFQLAGGVTDGAWFSLETLSLRDNVGIDRTADGVLDVAQACHASGMWGDLDGDGIVNSRDALATLSAAVGLPVPPQFDVAGRGDVDADGQVTSRDALAMLSASIGLSTGGFRVGNGIVDACAPELRLPRPLYFSRGSAFQPGQAGVSGLSIRTALDTTVTIVGDSSDATLQYEWRPRVSPDGSSVLFVCQNPYYYTPGICKADANGANPVHLTGQFATNTSPDWSPDGSEIVFAFPSGIWTMNADGTNQAQKLAVSPSGVSWRPIPGSRDVAYTDPSTGTVHVTNLDTGADILVHQFVCCSIYSPTWVDWNPAGDSLVFMVYVDGYYSIAKAPATANATVTSLAWASGTAEHPAWTDQGLLFAANYTRYRLFLQRTDGSVVQVGADATDEYQPGMKRQ